MRPIIRKSLEIQAAEHLRDAIVSGQFEPGQRLTETDLAQSLELSRGTARAALHHLAAEGLATLTPYTGWHVVALSAADIWELCTLRASLDALAARLAAQLSSRLPRDDIEAAFGRLQSACKDEKAHEARRAEWQLHKSIGAATAHGRLNAQYQLIEWQWLLYARIEVAAPMDFVALAAEHRQLLDAIFAGSADVAAAIAQNHALLAGQRLHASIARDQVRPVWPQVKLTEDRTMLNHVSVGTHDLTRAKQFYARVFAPLGLKTTVDSEKEVYFGTARDFVVFALYPVPAEKAVVGAQTHFALTAKDREEVAAVARAAQAQSAHLLHAAGPRPEIGPDYYGTMFKDLDGHVIEVLAAA